MAYGKVNISSNGIYNFIERVEDIYDSTPGTISGIFFIDSERNRYLINGTGNNFTIAKYAPDNTNIWKNNIPLGSYGPYILGVKQVQEYKDYLFFIVANSSEYGILYVINKNDGSGGIYIPESSYACSFDINGDRLVLFRLLNTNTNLPYKSIAVVNVYDIDPDSMDITLVLSKEIDGFMSEERLPTSDIAINDDGTVICIACKRDYFNYSDYGYGFVNFYDINTDSITRIPGYSVYTYRYHVVFYNGLFYTSKTAAYENSLIAYSYTEQGVEEIFNVSGLFGVAISGDRRRLFAKDKYLVHEINANGTIKKTIVPYVMRTEYPERYFRPLLVYGNRAYIEGGIYIEGI